MKYVRRCGLLMPQNEPDVTSWDECGPGCMLPAGHMGDHLIKNERGQYFFWGFDDEYCSADPDTCACLAEDGLIECCTYGIAENYELLTALRNVPWLVHYRLEEKSFELKAKEQLEFKF